MKQVFLSPQARDDLIAIGEYLMLHSPSAAVRTMKMLRKRIDLLAAFPYMGIARNDLLIGLRCLIVKEYLVSYQPTDDLVEILRICHSAQSQDDLFPF
jgi:toxin ParE1/3/4